MKIALTFLSLMLFIGVSATTPAFSTVTTDDQPIGTFQVQVNFGRNTDGTFYRTSAEGRITIVVGGFRTVGNQLELRLATETIRFEGPTSDINALPTALAYEWLAEEAARQAVIRGYITSSNVCSAPTVVKVLAESCVTRTWLGENTRITPCATYDMVAWQYALCGVSSAPTVARMYYENSFISCQSIGANCEATCPNGGQDGISIQ